MSFTPPASSRNAAIRPEEGWYSCGWRLLEAWLAKREWTYAQLGEAVGCSNGLISGWKSGRRCNAPFIARLEQLCGIAPEAWTWWTQDEPLEANEHPSSPPPASDKRPVADIDAPLGTTADELRRSVQRLEKLARTPGITPGQAATAEGKRVTALATLAKLEERLAIADHPDFAPLVEDLVAAVRSVFGSDAPDGLEAQIADELERLQAARAASPDRRAA